MKISTPAAAFGLLLAAASGAALAAGEPTQVAVQSYPSATSAWVSWTSDAPPVDTLFRVERRTVGSRAWYAVSGNLPGTARGFSEGQLRNSTAYEYRVVAILGGGTSVVSPTTAILNTPTAAATQADYDAAAAPRRIDAQAVSPTEIIVTWADQTPDETHFKVERRQGSGVWNAVATVPADTTLFKDTALTPASSYEYRVVAERNGQLPAISDASLAATPGTGAANTLRYVDGSVCNTSTNTSTLANPWKSIQLAAWALTAGQTVLVRSRADCATPTVYKTTPNAAGKHNFAVVMIGNDAPNLNNGPRSGTPSAWITFRNYPGERPKIRTNRGGGTTATNGNYHGISVRNASYIVVDGFEIEGHLNDVTLQEATDLNAFYKANPTASITTVVDGNGITVGFLSNTQTVSQIPHHVILRNNVIYNATGNGISALMADYVTTENNKVFNVAWYSPYGTSALSYNSPRDVDNNTSSYKMIVRGNEFRDAGNLFPCQCFNYAAPTDGNGIIMDLFTSTTGALGPYAGRALITNNLVTNNGGRGIHVFKSTNVDIVHNTVVRNSTIAVTGDGEITAQNSRNVRAYNNILVARTDRPTHLIQFANAAAKTADGASIDFDHNILFGGNPNAPQVIPSATRGALGPNNRLNLDPRFAAGNGNFRLNANSPAVDTAWTGAAGPAKDFLLAPRPRGAAADVGAIESF
jgi:parallel beta-helix repeat protein